MVGGNDIGIITSQVSIIQKWQIYCTFWTKISWKIARRCLDPEIVELGRFPEMLFAFKYYIDKDRIE